MPNEREPHVPLKRNQALINARLEKGWTQEDVGRRLSKNKVWVHNVEHGVGVHIKHAERFATLYGKPVHALFEPHQIGRRLRSDAKSPVINWELRRAREAKGFKLRDLARHTKADGVTLQALVAFEHLRAMPIDEKQQAIAKAVNVPAEVLFSKAGREISYDNRRNRDQRVVESLARPARFTPHALSTLNRAIHTLPLSWREMARLHWGLHPGRTALTAGEIAQRLYVDKKEVHKALLQFNKTVFALDARIKRPLKSLRWRERQKRVPLTRTLRRAFESRPTHSEEFQPRLDDQLSALQTALNNLEPRERDVLQRRFGFGGRAPEKFKDIRKTWNVSGERVRQIETDALKKLRTILSFQPDFEALRSATHSTQPHETTGKQRNATMKESPYTRRWAELVKQHGITAVDQALDTLPLHRAVVMRYRFGRVTGNTETNADTAKALQLYNETAGALTKLGLDQLEDALTSKKPPAN